MTARRRECFFEREADAPCPAGRLLLISYHFPPGQAAGALRWEKFSQHAAARGWGMDVLTLDPSSLRARDEARLRALPPGTRVFGVAERELWIERLERRTWGLYRALRPAPASNDAPGDAAPSEPSSYARQEVRFFGSPEPWRRAYHGALEIAHYRAWALAAARLGRRLLEHGAHRAVLSCGPPHPSHEGARRLAAAARLPLVLDFRDPWTLAERWPRDIASPVSLRLAAHYEARAARAAALVVMNTEPARDAMRKRYPGLAERIVAVSNGCDDDPLPRVERGRRFVIAYAGTVYLDRNPETLFRAAGRVVRELGLGPQELGIDFMGTVHELDGRSIEAIADEAGLGALVRMHPPGTRAQAAAFLAGASLLVNLPQDSHMAIPSKIFEYMRYDAGLLALAEPGSATEQLLRDTPADVVAPDDVDRLAAVLRERYLEHAAGRRPPPIAREGRFSRRAQAERLFGEIERIAAPGRSSPLAGVEPAQVGLGGDS